MSGLSRIVLRRRRWLRGELAALRGVPATALTVAALVVATGVLVVSTAKTDWKGLLQGFTSNVLTAALLAAFAYVVFVLRFRRAKLAQYLDRYRDHGPRPPSRRRARVQRLGRSHPGDDRGASGSDDPVMRAVVEELLTARPPRACLLVGAADIARGEALTQIAVLLAERKRVPIRLDLRREGRISSLPACIHDRFVADLVGAAGDAASGARVFTFLLERERAIAVVAGLESFGEGMSRRARQEAIGELLSACLNEHVPFVATLPDELTPGLNEVAVVRIPSVSRAEVAGYIVSRLRQRGYTFEPALDEQLEDLFAASTQPTRDPIYLELAVELLVERLRRGERGSDAAAELFAEPSSFRRHLGWMCEWAIACRLPEAATASSAAAFALRTIGTEAHYRQELPTTWDDVAGVMERDEERRFAGGVSALVRRGILSISDDDNRGALRFAHSGWLAFAGALGLGLDPTCWSDLLRPGTAHATLDAFTAALILDSAAPRKRERSFLVLIEQIADRDAAEVSLDIALAAIAAVQLDEGPLAIESAERSALEAAWRSSTDPVRLSFVARVDFSRSPQLVDFLWHQILASASGENTYRVRRAICERLALLGGAAWVLLGTRWKSLVEAARESDLSTRGRTRPPASDWNLYGLPLAHLCWVLPALTLALDGFARREAVGLLHDLRSVAAQGWATPTPDHERADIGIEISLAEGFKIAAGQTSDSRLSLEDWWVRETREFFHSAKSWVSQAVLLQALGLADPGRAGVGPLAREAAKSNRRHPFVREVAALVLQSVDSGATPVARQHHVWLDDVQALDDGGLELVPEAHRLLALTTLLINLAEHALKTNESRDEGVSSRDLAFTSDVLPHCFRRASHTATMFEFECDCGFGLCGRAVRGQGGERKFSRAGDRRFSRAFVKRAEATAGTRPLSEPRLFARQAFRDVWRSLDEELALEQVEENG